MSTAKFSGVFKGFDALKDIGITEVVQKAEPVERKAFPDKHFHFRSQQIAKSLRTEGSAGYWGAMRDRRYDDMVVGTLMKSGASETDVQQFLGSERGAELGSTVHSHVAKSIGLGAHVGRMFAQWQQKRDAVAKAEPVTAARKSATEYRPQN